MNQTTMTALIAERDRRAEQVAALDRLIAAYRDVHAPLTEERKEKISRGVRRALRRRTSGGDKKWTRVGMDARKEQVHRAILDMGGAGTIKGVQKFLGYSDTVTRTAMESLVKDRLLSRAKKAVAGGAFLYILSDQGAKAQVAVPALRDPSDA